jgi:hypothetical protein
MKTAPSASIFSTASDSSNSPAKGAAARLICPSNAAALRFAGWYCGTVRLRKVQGKLKVEHSILDGLRKVLERLLDDNPATIRSIIPGVIRPVRDAKGEVKIRVTVPTTNGWKAIALAAGARQELFISTNLSKDQLEQVIHQASRLGETP